MIKPQRMNPGWVDQDVGLSSMLTDLEQSLAYFAQGHMREGLDLLCQVREQLSSSQALPGALMTSLLEATTDYLRAEQVLHEASRRFADAARERQLHLEALTGFVCAAQSQALPLPYAHPFAESVAEQALYLPTLSLSTENTPLMTLAERESTLPALDIYCFGRFSVCRSGEAVQLCRNFKGQAILRYLVVRSDHQASMDMLMADLWPDEDAETALHKLRVAISALRCSLNREYVHTPGSGYILCKDRIYQLNPAVELRIDIVDFLDHYRAGGRARSRSEAAAHYERACELYRGPLLVEDLYAEWSFLQREELAKAYLDMCGKLAEYYLDAGKFEQAVDRAQAILKLDHCDEGAYRLLMRVYAAQGRRSEVLRRYQQCQQALAAELGLQPMLETQQLLQTILHAN